MRVTPNSVVSCRPHRRMSEDEYKDRRKEMDEAWENMVRLLAMDSECSHQWITTQGFTRQYTDCALCGAKKEDV
jgi:hypothetical protein